MSARSTVPPAGGGPASLGARGLGPAVPWRDELGASLPPPLWRRADVGRLRFGVSGRALPGGSGPLASADLGTAVDSDPARVAVARGRLALALGLPPSALRFATQVHGTRVVQADDLWPVPGPEADAVLVTTAGRAAGALGADCMPLLLGDPERGVGAAVHVGRAGLAAGVVPTAVAALAAAGAQRVLAVLGPTICGRCYEVPAALRAAVAEAIPAAASTTSWGTPSLDLPAGVRSQLTSGTGRGLDVTIDDSWAECTLESQQLFSHRRDAPTGRHAGVVAVLR